MVTKISEMLTEVREVNHRPASFLLMSDVHFDSPDCKRDLFFSHLQEAAENDAKVFVFGDFFDIMAGQHDRRRSKELLRPEYMKGNYIQEVVLNAAEMLRPYAHLFALISDGNHETAIRKNQEVDMNKWLCYELNRAGGNVVHGGYHGFVKFVFSAEDGGRVRSCLLYYHHGKYGGVVSKGVQGVARFASVVPQADIIVSGHTHDAWQVEQPQYYLKANGYVEIREQLHLKTATYKEAFAKPGGWDVEKIVLPKSLGGWWLNLEPDQRSGVHIGTVRAK